MSTIIVLTITVLMFFAVPVFAGDNCYEQRTSMEYQVAELAAQKKTDSKPLVAKVSHIRLAMNTQQPGEELALKKALNLMPFLAIK